MEMEWSWLEEVEGKEIGHGCVKKEGKEVKFGGGGGKGAGSWVKETRKVIE